MQLQLSWIKCATQLCSLLCLRSHTNATRKTCTCNCHELNVAHDWIALHVYDMTVWMIFMITITIIYVSFAEHRLFYRALLQKRPIIYITVWMVFMITITMGWLRSVGLIKLYVSFAEYRLFYRALLQKRPTILSILLTKATPERWLAILHSHSWHMAHEYQSHDLYSHQWHDTFTSATTNLHDIDHWFSSKSSFVFVTHDS